MIVSSRKYVFGLGQVGVVQSPAFCCAVSTAPDGLFKGYSTWIFVSEGEGASRTPRRPIAKATLHPNLSRPRRFEVHQTILTELDAFGTQGADLSIAIDATFTLLKRKNLLIDFVNLAILSPPNAQDSPGIAEAIADIADDIDAAARSERERGLALIKSVADRLGKWPITFNEAGEVYVDPELGRELDKPENVAIREMIRIAFWATREQR